MVKDGTQRNFLDLIGYKLSRVALLFLLIFPTVTLTITISPFHHGFIEAYAYGQGGGGAGPPPGSAITDVVADGDSVYVVWADYNDKKHEYSTWIRASHDGGHTFEKATDLGDVSDSSDRSLFTHMGNIQIAASGSNNLFLGWSSQNPNSTENGHDAPYHAYFMKSTDGGHTFGSPIILDGNSNDNRTGTNARSFGVQKLVVLGDLVYAILSYNDNTAEQHGGFMIRASSDTGETFGDAVDIFSWPEITDGWMQIATSSDGNNVYAVAQGRPSFDGDIVNGALGVIFKSSNNGGQTFGSATDLNEGSNAAIFAPTIAASGKHDVYVAWSELDPADKRTTYAYFRASNDDGRTFGEKIKLDTIPEKPSEIRNSDFVQVSAERDSKNDSNVYVKWWDLHFSNDMTNEQGHLLIRASNDGGKTFGNAVDITGNQAHFGDIGQSAIVVVPSTESGGKDQVSTSTNTAKDNAYAVWTADTDFPAASSKIFLSRSVDAGHTFDVVTQLPKQVDAKNGAANVRIAVSSSNVYLSWDSGSSGVHGLFLAASNNDGKSFGDPINLVELPGQQIVPEFASPSVSIIIVSAAAIASSISIAKYVKSRK